MVGGPGAWPYRVQLAVNRASNWRKGRLGEAGRHGATQAEQDNLRVPPADVHSHSTAPNQPRNHAVLHRARPRRGPARHRPAQPGRRRLQAGWRPPGAAAAPGHACGPCASPLRRPSAARHRRPAPPGAWWCSPPPSRSRLRPPSRCAAAGPGSRSPPHLGAGAGGRAARAIAIAGRRRLPWALRRAGSAPRPRALAGRQCSPACVRPRRPRPIGTRAGQGPFRPPCRTPAAIRLRHTPCLPAAGGRGDLRGRPVRRVVSAPFGPKIRAGCFHRQQYSLACTLVPAAQPAAEPAAVMPSSS